MPADPPLRVLHVTLNLGVGGLERVVYNLCVHSAERGVRSSVVCLHFGGAFAERLREKGIPIHVLASDPARPPRDSFRSIARILREGRFDAVHSHNTGPFLQGALGSFLGSIPTLIHTDHGRGTPGLLRWRIAEHLLAGMAWRVVGVSPETTSALARHARIHPSRLETIPNGVPASLPSGTRDGLRARLGVPADSVVGGWIGRLVPQKGIDLLLEALAHGRVPPNLTVLLAGDGPERGPLEARARALGIDGRVRFLGTRMDGPDLLAAFDLYVLPSRWEGLPLALLEAMAARLPVVAASVGGVPEAVVHQQSGLLVRPGDPAGLSGAMARLAADPGLRRSLGEAGYLRFREQFSMDRMVDRYSRLYRRIPAADLGSAA